MVQRCNSIAKDWCYV